MPQQLSYQPASPGSSAARRLTPPVLATRSGRLLLLVALYAATYAGLRATRLLVHRTYCTYENVVYGEYVHDIGHGPYVDARGARIDDPLDRAFRLVFYPLMRIEAYAWHRYAP